jgi:DNA helicase-2/ATP-dependent DNA helicase PcrA
MKIEHSRFGTGTITKVDSQSADARIVVQFTNVGEKTLLLKFAKFNIIG